VSAFGDSTCPVFISKLKTFERALLAAQKLYEGHDYAIRSSPQTFITEVLFIDWIDTIFLLRISELRQIFNYHRPSVLIADEHSTHVTPRVIALWNSECHRDQAGRALVTSRAATRLVCFRII
jgi:hypothetical protein